MSGTDPIFPASGMQPVMPVERVAPEAASASAERAVPLAQFARMIGPQTTTTVTVVNGQRRTTTTVLPGTGEEMWLKLLAIRHPNERHTPSEWRALIARYADEPAHPADPRYGRSA